MNQLPKVGIIYLTYPTPNWERDINRCLTSMEQLNYPKDRIELICVESKGKLPPVQPWFEKTWLPKSGTSLPRITYIFNDEWIGFSGNNNLGYDKAKELGCEYVHLTNEDTDIDLAYLLRAVERAESDPKIAQVQSLLVLGEEREKINSSGNAFHYLGFGYSRDYLSGTKDTITKLELERRTNPDLEIGYASGAAVLCRVKAIEACGGLFDSGFFSYHEDTDASLQAKIRGWKVVIEPSSIVYHYFEFAKSKINYYWMERNRYVLMFSFYKAWTLFLLWPMILLMDLGILAFSIKNGWADMKWKVYQDFLKKEFWTWIKLRRKRIQTERVISDRVLLKNAVSSIEFQAEGVKNPLLQYVGNPILKIYWWAAKSLLL